MHRDLRRENQETTEMEMELKFKYTFGHLFPAKIAKNEIVIFSRGSMIKNTLHAGMHKTTH